ncbi:ParA family protein [Haloplanus pelagicus]|jgi:cellulose biosynthesis protein BcsQ|uniref:ParA family protein n=1 Tax=Haloplanus pelagicus TaxID=2949995 RepID=UPI00203D16CF|nr:hypothetical protein [Haloplanus sp. HW8-1]
MVYVCTVVGPTDGVDKTVTVAALGTLLVDAGHDVLLVDFDPTDPGLAEQFDDCDTGPTVRDVLAGDAPRRSAPEAGSTEVVVPGRRGTPAAPKELRAAAFDAFDLVLIDTGPPTAPHTDAALDVADGVLTVSTVHSRRTPSAVRDRPDLRDPEHLGSVLTRADASVDPADPDRPVIARVPGVGDANTPSLVRDAPDHPAAVAYRRLAAVVAERSRPGDDATPSGSSDRSDASTFAADETARLVTSRRVLLTLVMGVVGAVSTGVLGPGDDDPTDAVADIDGFGYGGTPVADATTDAPGTTATTATATAVVTATQTDDGTPTATPEATTADATTTTPTATSEPTATPTPTPDSTATATSEQSAGMTGGGGGGGGGGAGDSSTATATPTPTATSDDDFGEVGYGEGGYGGNV